MFFKCEIHGEKFSSLEAIKEHDAQFHATKSVIGGVAEEEGELPFKCSECGRSFKESSIFKRHIFTHSTNEPFCCHICKKRFAHPHQLKTHLKTFHSSTPPKKCNSFLTLSQQYKQPLIKSNCRFKTKKI
jgi:KRAB domain-containing zinc finger protein